MCASRSCFVLSVLMLVQITNYQDLPSVQKIPDKDAVLVPARSRAVEGGGIVRDFFPCSLSV